MNSKISPVVFIPVILAMTIWGFSYVWYKQAYQYYGPVTVIMLRLAIAVPLLFILSWMLKKLQRIRKIHLTWFLLLGFFEPFLYFLGESYGVKMISSTLAALIISMIPIFVTIPARVLFREKVTWMHYTGILISITGVAMVISAENISAGTRLSGILLMMVAVISTIFHSVYVRKLADHYNTFTIVTYQTVFGLAYFIPLFLFTSFNRFIHMHHSLVMMIPVIKLSVFASVIAFLFFVFSIKRIGIAGTSAFVNLIPAVTAVLSFFLLKEDFGQIRIAGIIIVITGLFISQYRLAGNVGKMTAE